MSELSAKTAYTLYRNDAAEDWYGGDHSWDWRQEVFERIADHLSRRGLNVDIETRETFEVRLFGLLRRQLKIRDSLAFLQDNRTSQYRVFDCHDWVDPDDIRLLMRDWRCRLILKCHYNRNAFRSLRYGIVKPWTYFDYYWPSIQQRLSAFRRRRRSQNDLYFRGHPWKERKAVLKILQTRGILNADNGPVPFDQYLEESSRQRIVLSLPGMADFCHRDIEAFGMGTCVLRPEFPNQFHEQLKADHHYVSVDTDIEFDPPGEAADRIEERYRQVIKDRDFLAFVASNAMDWYDRNVRVPESLELTENLLGLAHLMI